MLHPGSYERVLMEFDVESLNKIFSCDVILAIIFPV
jgi:hypothetical protein